MKQSVHFIRSYASPLGEMILSSDGEALTGLWFKDQKHLPDWLCDVNRLTVGAGVGTGAGAGAGAEAGARAGAETGTGTGAETDAGLLRDPSHSVSDRPVPVLDEAVRWLDSYFAGREPGFTPLLRPYKPSPFRQKVWDALREIPYGETRTYGEIAEKIGCRHSAQAVGNAVGHNPISLIIPCHRVLGKDGSLTGYAGGLERKAWLLRLEGTSPE